MLPPVAKRVPHTLTAHGQSRTDYYFWLRDRGDSDTLAYLEAENKYFAEQMAPLAPLTEKLYQEILGRIQETDLSVPVKRGPYFYYSRTEQGKQYAYSCRKQGSLEAPEELLLDGNALAEGKQYFRIGNSTISPDHRLLAYSVDYDGDEVYTTVCKDVSTGEHFAEQIPNTYYGLVWANDNRHFFYTTLDAAKRPCRVHRHELGTDSAQDVVVFEEADERFYVHIGKVSSERFIVIHSGSFTTTELHLIDADQPLSPLRLVLPRQQDREYDLDHHTDRFYLRVNDTGRNFRLVSAPTDSFAPEQWTEEIPHRPNVMLEGVQTFAHHLVIAEREDGLPKLRIRSFDSGAEHHIAFPEPAYDVAATGNAEFDTRTLRFHYTSLVTPGSVFDYDMDTQTRELKKQTPVLGGYDAGQYRSERIHATAPDGTAIPISLVYKQGTPLDGSAPCYLYGYGSYGVTIDPSFSHGRLSLLDRGFVYAIAHIRGGGDLGKPWHDAGKLLHKRHTFTDFIAAAEHLIAQRYTSADRLAIAGGSAGGLLVGACINMRPELYHAVIAHVPFVDVLNTAQDATLPLTVGEFEEWGNSIESQEVFEYIRSYSPYDNVEAKGYPHLFVTGGLNDPRVSYWEPAKWVAKLRYCRTNENRLLLKTEMGAGHSGPSGRYEAIREVAQEFAWLLDVMGKADQQ